VEIWLNEVCDRCLPLCGRKSQKKERVKRVVTLEEEKIIRWAIDNREDWGKEKEIRRTIEKSKN